MLMSAADESLTLESLRRERDALKAERDKLKLMVDIINAMHEALKVAAD